MTDHDDKLKRAYRGLGNEEPPAALDAAILARARERVVPRRRPSWMVPVSIAAVLVLGIGVSLRMKLEQPGIETSVPAPAAVPERPAPATPPAPATTAPAASEVARDSAAPVAAPELKRVPQKVDALRQKERFDEARPQSNVAPAQAPLEAAQSREEKPASADAISAPSSKAQTNTSVAVEPPPAAASPPAPAAGAPSLRLAPQSMQAPSRAKREAEPDAAPGARDLRKSLVTPEADPVRELERIAQLRAEGRHAEADRALEEFRRLRPDYRIPEAVWERVKPR